MKNIMKHLRLEKDPKTTFTEVVKENFSFLIEDFDFSLSIRPTKRRNDPFIDGAPIFRSSRMTIGFEIDFGGVVTVLLSSEKDPELFAPTVLASIIRFLSPDLPMTSRFVWPVKGEKWEPWITRQIIEQAKMLRKYSYQILDKESSEWIDYIVHDRKQAEILYQATPNRIMKIKQ